MTAETLDSQFQKMAEARTHSAPVGTLTRGTEFEHDHHRFIMTTHKFAPDATGVLCVCLAGEKRGEVWHIDPATLVTLPERTLLPPGDSTAS